MLNSSLLTSKRIDNQFFLLYQLLTSFSPSQYPERRTLASYPANFAPPWKKYPTAVGPNPVKSPLVPSEATIFLPADKSESLASAGSIWILVLTTSIAARQRSLGSHGIGPRYIGGKSKWDRGDGVDKMEMRLTGHTTMRPDPLALSKLQGAKQLTGYSIEHRPRRKYCNP